MNIKEVAEIRTRNIKGTAYTKSVQLCERKKNYLVNLTYPNAGKVDLLKEVYIPEKYIPYDVHGYVSEICMSFRDTISEFTSVPQEYMSVTFIYHYDYPEANDDDKSWRWVIGKEATTQIELNYFVTQCPTLYNYMVSGCHGDVTNVVFCNNKIELALTGHYQMSSRDKDHNQNGSVFAVKVAFGNNAHNFVEGILLISTYGKKFVEAGSNFDVDELKNVLLEELYPYYQRLLETELGMLYLRHKKAQKEGTPE